MKIHESRPRAGKARRIWDGLVRMELSPTSLWYNPNNWGQNQMDGWGTWAFAGAVESWCGEDARGVYIENSSPPFAKLYEKRNDHA